MTEISSQMNTQTAAITATYSAEQNLGAILALLNDDIAAFARYRGIPRGLLIEQVKNNTKALKSLLGFTYDEPQPEAKYDLWSGVEKQKTFELYMRFGLEPRGLDQSRVSPSQWAYLESIRFTPALWCADCAEMRTITDDMRAMCGECTVRDADKLFDDMARVSIGQKRRATVELSRSNYSA